MYSGNFDKLSEYCSGREGSGRKGRVRQKVRMAVEEDDKGS